MSGQAASQQLSGDLENPRVGILRHLKSIQRQFDRWFSKPDLLRYRGFASSQVGRDHAVGADIFRLYDDMALYLIADGFGAERDAEDAALIGINQFVERFTEVDRHVIGTTRGPAFSTRHAIQVVRQSFAAAANAVNAFCDLSDAVCGASMAVAVCTGDAAIIASMGSCRVYSLKRGRLVQVTHDDTIGAELRRADGKSPATGRTRYDKMLSKCLGDGETLFPAITTVSLRDADCLLLLTDGIYRSLSDDEIKSIATSDPTASAPVRLVTAVRAAGGTDDCAAVIVKVTSLASVPVDACDKVIVENDAATAQYQPMPVA